MSTSRTDRRLQHQFFSPHSDQVDAAAWSRTRRAKMGKGHERLGIRCHMSVIRDETDCRDYCMKTYGWSMKIESLIWFICGNFARSRKRWGFVFFTESFWWSFQFFEKIKEKILRFSKRKYLYQKSNWLQTNYYQCANSSERVMTFSIFEKFETRESNTLKANYFWLQIYNNLSNALNLWTSHD